MSGLFRWLSAIGRTWPSRPPRRLRVCETVSLGERRFLAVVDYEQQKFLIGGTGSSLALLAELGRCAPREEVRTAEGENEGAA